MGVEETVPHRYNQYTLIDILQWRAVNTANVLAYSFFKDGLEETEKLSYGELNQLACRAAQFLLKRSVQRQPVLLLYPAGLDFLVAFLGCMMARCLPVPIPMFNNTTLKRTLPRFVSIVRGSGASAVLTNLNDENNLVSTKLLSNSPISELEWIDHNALISSMSPARASEISTELDSIAFLQFTSGSTGEPRGIKITHKNLAHQFAALKRCGSYDPESAIVNWMPHFHDLGLIQGLLLPLYLGIPCLTMPPIAFLRHPDRWLKLIGRYRATHSCGPNFAYDYCCHSLNSRDLEGLDLRCWRAAGISAEPISPYTIHRFASLLQRTGFQLGTFCPAFGLAESTLCVSHNRPQHTPVFCDVDANALSGGEIRLAPQGECNVRTLVGCGQVIGYGTHVVIANPDKLTRCYENIVGEIWVSSDSIAEGYWSAQPDQSEVFRAYLQDTGEGPFLRTGDLGFLKDGELFVTGRLKDIIIVAGQNHYPHDLERTAEASHPSLRTQSCSAFSFMKDGQEQVVILVET